MFQFQPPPPPPPPPAGPSHNSPLQRAAAATDVWTQVVIRSRKSPEHRRSAATALAACRPAMEPAAAATEAEITPADFADALDAECELSGQTSRIFGDK